MFCNAELSLLPYLHGRSGLLPYQKAALRMPIRSDTLLMLMRQVIAPWPGAVVVQGGCWFLASLLGNLSYWAAEQAPDDKIAAAAQIIRECEHALDFHQYSDEKDREFVERALTVRRR